MKDFDFKKLIPHVIAIVVFALAALIYCAPVFDGKAVKQDDINQHKGMSKEVVDHRELNDEEPLWTGHPFGGMPATQISVLYPSNLLMYIDRAMKLGLPHPANLIFLCMLGFYILLMCMKVDPWLGIAGAFGFALSTYFIIVLPAGHNSKLVAMAYMAPALGGIIMTLRGKMLLGGAVTMLFMALELRSNHYQITYYLLLIVFFFFIAELVRVVKEKSYMDFLKRSGIIAAAIVMALLANAGNMYSTLEYAPYTQRGKSELTINSPGKTGPKEGDGLDISYITRWSYGKGETFNLLIPNAKGKGSGAVYDLDFVEDKDIPDEFKRYVATEMQKYQESGGRQGHLVNTYWGEQLGGTAGPVYLGAVLIFLFILSMVYLEDKRLKWALFAITVLAIMLSWGKNYVSWFVLIPCLLYPLSTMFKGKQRIGFLAANTLLLFFLLYIFGEKGVAGESSLTEFFANNIPMYNKFRAVTMILVIAELTIPLLAILFIKKIIDKPEILQRSVKLGEQKVNLLYLVSGIFGFILLLFLAMPETFFEFLSAGDKAHFSRPEAVGKGNQLLVEHRVGEFRADLMRTLFLIVLSFVAIFAYIRKWINPKMLIAGIGLLITIDLWMIDKRYLNNEEEAGVYTQWEDEEDKLRPFNAYAGDKEIMAREIGTDTELKNRIDLAVLKANEAADMKLTVKQQEGIRFRELNLARHYRVFNESDGWNDGRTPYYHRTVGGYSAVKLKRYQELIDFHLGRKGENALNMLNVKYFFQVGRLPNSNKSDSKVTRVNTNALGSAWFVNEIVWADNPDDEIRKLDKMFAIKDISGGAGVYLNDKPISEANIAIFESPLLIRKGMSKKDGLPLSLAYFTQKPMEMNREYTFGSAQTCDYPVPDSTFFPQHMSIKMIWDFNPATQVLIDKKYKKQMGNYQVSADPGASIQLTKYKANHLTYHTKSSSDQFAVFSEVYYDLGWKAKIDGKEVPIYRVNYTLRGLKVPAGDHKIEFVYRMPSYDTGSTISLAGSGLLIIIVLAIFYMEIKKNHLAGTNGDSDPDATADA
jgi:hypothetical protein